MEHSVIRYSDEDLVEFKKIIDQKQELAKENLQGLESQLVEVTENNYDEFGGDWMDDTETNNELEYLNNMIIRQKKYIQDLDNALVRIKNKTYGVCVVTGKLIDKKRLLAVPHATKSVEAKLNQKSEDEPIITRNEIPTSSGNESEDDF